MKLQETVQYEAVQRSTLQHRTVSFCTEPYGIFPRGTFPHGTFPHGTVCFRSWVQVCSPYVYRTIIIIYCMDSCRIVHNNTIPCGTVRCRRSDTFYISLVGQAGELAKGNAHHSSKAIPVAYCNKETNVASSDERRGGPPFRQQPLKPFWQQPLHHRSQPACLLK